MRRDNPFGALVAITDPWPLWGIKKRMQSVIAFFELNHERGTVVVRL